MAASASARPVTATRRWRQLVANGDQAGPTGRGDAGPAHLDPRRRRLPKSYESIMATPVLGSASKETSGICRQLVLLTLSW